MVDNSGKEPAWLGSEISATISKCEVIDDAKKGKQLLIGLAMRMELRLMKIMPAWLEDAADPECLEFLLTSAKLTQPGCRIGLEFKGYPGQQDPHLKIEAASLAPGLRIKLPADPEKRVIADGCISIKVDYNEERVRYFGDRLDTLVTFRAFSAATERQQLRIPEAQTATRPTATKARNVGRSKSGTRRRRA